MGFMAAAIGGSALIGGITSMIGSSKAASAAKDAANQAQQRYIQTRSDLHALQHRRPGRAADDERAGDGPHGWRARLRLARRRDDAAGR